jgi:hypothetical protein
MKLNCFLYIRTYANQQCSLEKISFLKARQRRAFKKPILVFPMPSALETPKSVS